MCQRNNQHFSIFTWRITRAVLEQAAIVIFCLALPASTTRIPGAFLHGNGYECFCPFLDRSVSYAFNLRTNVSANAELSKVRVAGLARIASNAMQSGDGTIWLHTVELEDIQLLKSYAESGSDAETTIHQHPSISGIFEQRRCEDVERTWISPHLSQSQISLLNGIVADLTFAVPTQNIRSYRFDRSRHGGMQTTRLDVRHGDANKSRGKAGQIEVRLSSSLRTVVPIRKECKSGFADWWRKKSPTWSARRENEDEVEGEDQDHPTVTRATIRATDGVLLQLISQTDVRLPQTKKGRETGPAERSPTEFGVSLSLGILGLGRGLDAEQAEAVFLRTQSGLGGIHSETKVHEGIPFFGPSSLDSLKHVCSYHLGNEGQRAVLSSWDVVQPHRTWRCVLKLL
eukprot:3719086-Rhodomonas_salina.1